jgi:WD40 repeat protein
MVDRRVPGLGPASAMRATPTEVAAARLKVKRAKRRGEKVDAATEAIASASAPGPVTALVAVPLPDGRILLVSAGQDGSVRMWDPAVGAPVGVLEGHLGPVTALVAVPLPDGRSLLVSAGQDGSVRMWDPAVGAPVGVLEGHQGPVTALVAVPLSDGRIGLAIGNAFGAVSTEDLQGVA